MCRMWGWLQCVSSLRRTIVIKMIVTEENIHPLRQNSSQSEEDGLEWTVTESSQQATAVKARHIQLW